ncbi:uncharacterized protein LOC108096163 [Drosophila ficusphila]|uniref:uncharacterized protein LOC108096163 n=1 Tax=Drosophila ficusphila TaxID=30025 RepID=UPI0007E61D77|nr:uncharacterized protein LOC108096163 [Drosophila ficusphila]
MDLGKPNGESELEDYIDPEEHPDDHLTRPDIDYVNSDNEGKIPDEDHNEIPDHITVGNTDDPDAVNDISFEFDIQSHDDHLTTESEVLSYDPGERKVSRMLYVLSQGLLNYFKDDQSLDQMLYHQIDPYDKYEIEDRIVRYAMHKWHEEI